MQSDRNGEENMTMLPTTNIQNTSIVAQTHLAVSEAYRSDLALGQAMKMGLGHTGPLARTMPCQPKSWGASLASSIEVRGGAS